MSYIGYVDLCLSFLIGLIGIGVIDYIGKSLDISSKFFVYSSAGIWEGERNKVLLHAEYNCSYVIRSFVFLQPCFHINIIM